MISPEMIAVVIMVIGVSALWKHLLDSVTHNRKKIEKVKSEHEKDMEYIEEQINEKMEDIKDVVKCSNTMGQDERDRLTRIDENVSNLGDRMEKLERRIDRISRLKFKDDGKGG